jgi:hypothetical protein
MTAMTDAQARSAPHEVGYGKPPRHTQFRKGQSGNPGGRSRGLPVQRARALLLEEAYRGVAIKENGRMVPVTALQAILRSQAELAINGNYRAQRDILEAVQNLEFKKSIGAYDDSVIEDEDDVDEWDEEDQEDEDDESGEAWGPVKQAKAAKPMDLRGRRSRRKRRSRCDQRDRCDRRSRRNRRGR